MKKIIFNNKAIVFLIIFFLIISFKNASHALTLEDLAEKYKENAGPLINPGFNFQNMVSVRLTVDNKINNTNDGPYHGIKENDPNAEDPNAENPNAEDPNAQNAMLTEQARQNAIVNHRRFKLHRFKIWGGQDGGQTEFRICAVVGKIQVVDYATDGKIEIMSNRMESDVLLVRTKGFGKVYVTAYYYDDFTAQWYKDSTECIVQVVSPLFPGNVPSNPDNGYYELGGLDRNYRLNLDIGQTKTCNVIIKDNRGITLGNLQDFTVYNIEYDSDYISVKQDGTSFNITGLKEGSSYLYIQFQAKDFFGNYKRYYGVWANVEVYEHYSPPFTPGQDDPSNLEGDKEIPEEIKFEFSSYSIKQGDSITLKLFKKVDGEFVEVTDIDNYRFESSNTDVAYFLTQHSAYLKTSESGQVTITVSRSFAKDNINIDKTLTASASVYVSRQFK